jgi:hypothetical protein
MGLTKVTYSMIEGAVANVLDFGAVGDGSTDDTTAIQNAINEAAAVVYFPSGVYKVSSLNLIDGISLVGENPYHSVILASDATSTVINCGVSNEIKNLKITPSVTKTAGFLVDIQGNGCLIENCELEDYYIGVNVGTIGDPVTVNARVFNSVFRSSNVRAGSGAVQFVNFSNAQISNCVITGTDISSIQPDWGIRFQNGDTAFVTDCNVTVHGKALNVDTPAGLNCYALTVTGSVFDSAHQITGGTAVASGTFAPAGNVFNTRIANCWFGLASIKSGCLLEPTGGGLIDGITFTGCEFTDNGESGFLAVGGNSKNWIVTGGHSSGNAAAGIRAAAGTVNFIITGHIAGPVGNRGPNDKGIVVDVGSSNDYVIADNIVVGNTTLGLSDGGTGTLARVVNNEGYNGASNLVGLAVSASPWTHTCSHSPETIYIQGGTGLGISVDAQVIFITTGVTVQLQPSEQMTITYSTIPTVYKKMN